MVSGTGGGFKGYIEDRRGRGLHLTPKGREVILKAYPVWREAQTRSIRIMGPESRATLDGLLMQAEKLAAA